MNFFLITIMSSHLITKAFFGKNICLHVYLNKNKECYFAFGVPNNKNGSGWQWKSVKFNDSEIGDIIGVIDGLKDSANFFHSFKTEKTQIWIRKKGSSLFIKTKDYVKGLNFGEQMVLRELLKHIIIRTSIPF